MQTLSLALVEDCWLEICGLTPALEAELMSRFRQAQPALFGFLRAAQEATFQGEDRGCLLLYGLWVWLAFHKAHGTTREITEDDIERALSANERHIAELHAAGGPLMDKAAGWTSTYAQMPLLAAIINRAMEGDLEEGRRVDDLLGVLILYLKTAIDCFQK